MAVGGSLEKLQQSLGHSFANPGLLAEALRHSSDPDVQKGGAASNQRLEFLGDRVLGLVVAEWLLQRYPGEAEGEIAGIAVAQDAGAAGVGRKITADLATSFGAQTQGKKSISVQGRLLNIRQDTAGFDRDRVIDWVDADDSIHSPQVENNLSGTRYRPST